MKNRKNLGCRIKGSRERGAWAELYFMALAAGQGLKISSPYGGFASYDVGLETTGPILRVQVKCTMCRHPKGGYSLNIRGPKYRGYPKGTVDFFALYIIPTDDWFIIPYAVIGKRYATLHFTPASQRQKHGKYLEAWNLLLTAAKRRGDHRIDIQACCEHENVAEPGQETLPSRARPVNSQPIVRKSYRKMFRMLFRRGSAGRRKA
jgi:hypothetical protein